MDEIVLYRSSGHHHSNELLVVNVAVSVDICLPNHLINFFVGEFFAQVGHDVSKFGGGNEAVSVSIEYFEGFDELLFSIGVLHFSMMII